MSSYYDGNSEREWPSSEDSEELELPHLKEERDRLDRIRAAMVSVFGGMGKGSSIWGQGQWDKGWTAGVQAALLAFDTERKK